MRLKKQGLDFMTRQDALDILTKIQNQLQNQGRDIMTWGGMCDTPEEIIKHAKRYDNQGLIS